MPVSDGPELHSSAQRTCPHDSSDFGGLEQVFVANYSGAEGNDVTTGRYTISNHLLVTILSSDVKDIKVKGKKYEFRRL